MEELIFSLITCFLHRRFFPKGEAVWRASRTYRKMSGKPGTVRARSDKDSMNDGTVSAVSGLGHRVPVLPSVSPGTLSVDPEAVMTPGAGMDMPAVPVQYLQEAAAASSEARESEQELWPFIAAPPARRCSHALFPEFCEASAWDAAVFLFSPGWVYRH